MEGKRSSAAEKDSINNGAASSSAESWALRARRDNTASAAELFQRLNQIPLDQIHPPSRELSSSEFLDYLKNQSPGGQYGIAAGGNSSRRNYYNDKNQDYERGAIDQCDITSSVDYGSRDYYRPATHASGNPIVHKEYESDEACSQCIDSRGNWWRGSLYY